MTIRWIHAGALALVTFCAACGDNKGAAPTEDAAVPTDAAIDTPPPIDAVDAPPGVTGPCLDRPGDLPRPPTGALPCDLLPPGFAP